MAGAIKIFNLNRSLFEAFKQITFDSELFSQGIESELGERIVMVEQSLKRTVGRKIVAWYNSPNTTMESVVNQLQEKFGVNRAKLISQNEITYLHSRVQEETAVKIGVETWWWSTRRDQIVCKKPLTGPDGYTYQGCRELHGKIFTIGQPMPPGGSHIGCRCTAILIVPHTPPRALERLLGASFAGKRIRKFDESKHPRKGDGKFAPKEESDFKPTKPQQKPTIDSIKPDEKQTEAIISEWDKTYGTNSGGPFWETKEENNPKYHLIRDENGKMIGGATTVQRGFGTQILSIESKQAGAGIQLLSALKEKNIFLYVASSSKESDKWYEHFGFKRDDNHPHQYNYVWVKRQIEVK